MSNGQDQSMNESISALMDGEASEIELHRVLKESETSQEVRDTWSRYHMVGAVLKGENDKIGNIDLSSSISAAIANEQTVVQRHFWRDGLAKTAIAASVAFAFVVGVQQFNTDQVSSDDAIAIAPNNAVVPEGFEQPNINARTVSFGQAEVNPGPFSFSMPSNSEVEQKILVDESQLNDHVNRILLKHAQHTSANGALGVIPYARVNYIEAVQE